MMKEKPPAETIFYHAHETSCLEVSTEDDGVTFKFDMPRGAVYLNRVEAILLVKKLSTKLGLGE